MKKSTKAQTTNGQYDKTFLDHVPSPGRLWRSMSHRHATEGHLYALPRFSNTQWVALVARHVQGVLVAHFYPGVETAGLAPPALTRMVSDMGIRKGEWQDQGELHGWSRGKWPVPQFRRLMPWERPSNVTTVVTYGDDITAAPVSEVLEGSFEHLPLDGLSGYKAIEAHLKRLERSLDDLR